MSGLSNSPGQSPRPTRTEELRVQGGAGTRSPTPKSLTEETEDHNRTSVLESDSPRSARNIDDDEEEDEHQRNSSSSPKKNRKQQRKSPYRKLLLENEKLRTEKVDLDKQIRVLEQHCEDRNKEIETYREQQTAAEEFAERLRLAAEEVQSSKNDVDREMLQAKAEIRSVKEENAKLLLLAPLQELLNDAEEQAGSFYGEIQDKEFELVVLREETRTLRQSNKQVEEELQKKRVECEDLREETQQLSEWLDKIHEQQRKER